MARYPIKCWGCGKKKSEEKLRIYSVSADKYYCNQRHKDKADGLVRDEAGFVVEMFTNEKQCLKCKAVKDKSEFGKNRTKKDGLQNYCRICHNAVKENNGKKAEDKEAKISQAT